jgi:glycerol-3-phosphate O-acyltransferase
VVVVPLLARALLVGNVACGNANLKTVLEAEMSASSAKSFVVPADELIYVANRALAQLEEREIVELRDGAWSVLPNKRKVLAFYASSIAHYYKREVKA